MELMSRSLLNDSRTINYSTPRTTHYSPGEEATAILLRRDLHTLYDRGLLRITETGHIQLDDRVVDHYAELDKVTVADWLATSTY